MQPGDRQIEQYGSQSVSAGVAADSDGLQDVLNTGQRQLGLGLSCKHAPEQHPTSSACQTLTENVVGLRHVRHKL